MYKRIFILIVIIALSIGGLNYSIGQSLITLEKALEIARELKDGYLEAMALSNLAYAMGVSQSDYSTALDYFEKAYSIVSFMGRGRPNQFYIDLEKVTISRREIRKIGLMVQSQHTAFWGDWHGRCGNRRGSAHSHWRTGRGPGWNPPG